MRHVCSEKTSLPMAARNLSVAGDRDALSVAELQSALSKTLFYASRQPRVCLHHPHMYVFVHVRARRRILVCSLVRFPVPEKLKLALESHGSLSAIARIDHANSMYPHHKVSLNMFH